MKTVRSFALWCLVGLGACQGTGQLSLEESQEAQALSAGQLNGAGLPAKTVVFTYDDGPDEHTLPLARYLAENKIKATFFVNGRRFCKTFDAAGTCVTPQETRPCMGAPQASVAAPKYYPESLLDELIALGHRVGNHTQDHCHMGGQTNDENVVFEVKATQDILNRHICDGVYLFRAPYGEWSAGVLGRLGTYMDANKIRGPVNWEVDGQDWDCWQKRATPEACANRYLNILRGRGSQNGIFLMHDRPEFNVGYDGPLLMTKILVERLKAEGYRFGTIDEALRLPASPDAGAACPAAVDAGAGPANDAGAPDVPVVADAGPPVDVPRPDTAVPPPGNPPPGTGGAPVAGTGGAGVNPPSMGTGALPAGTGGRARDPDPAQSDDAEGGCSVAAGAARGGHASAFLLLALAAAGSVRRRRRQH